jgi:hypothetical protein
VASVHSSKASRRRRPGAGTGRAVCAGALATLVTGLALATAPAAPAAPAAPTRPTAPAPTAADCQNLLKQFDVAWPAHRDSARSASAQHSRDLGEADCRAGRYPEGVHNLRRALHDIGVKPVKQISLAPRA